jgi:SAM-dependent methyltransferase
MPTPGEFTYYQRLPEESREHALNKPFSDPRAGPMLMEAGAILLLLPPSPCRVLECGCGTGWLSYLLAKSGYEVVGQDVNAKAIELARANPLFGSSMRVPQFVEGDFEKSNFRNEFEALVFFDALHHSVDLPLAFSRAFEALKPGGVLIASEPGLGHAARSREFAQTWDVTDQDTPPSLTLALGRAAGFVSGRIYPHAETLVPALFRRKSGGGLARILRICYHCVLARRNGIVLLEKGLEPLPR